MTWSAADPELVSLVREIVQSEIDSYFRGVAETMLLETSVQDGDVLAGMPTMRGLMDELMPLIGEGYRR